MKFFNREDVMAFLAIVLNFLIGFFVIRLILPMYFSLLVCAGINICIYVSMIFGKRIPALEKLIWKKMGIEPQKNSELEKNTRAVFDLCVSQAEQMNPRLSKKKIYLSFIDQEGFNAMVLGKRFICMTKQLAEMDPQYLDAVFMHELGHLSDKKTRWENVLCAGELFMLLLWYASLAASFIYAATGIGRFFTGQTVMYSMIKALLLSIGVSLFLAEWRKLRKKMLKEFYLQREFEADAFVVNAGLGKKLGAVLMMLNELNTGIQTRKESLAFCGTSDVELRILNIVKLLKQREVR